jgi:beta-1,4-N-acetylglucosaminyltransferase
MKVCLVCSHGGHLTELLQLLPAFRGQQLVIATYHSARDDQVRALARAYFTANAGRSPWRMARTALWALHILRIERPAAIVSLGAEIALPFFYLGRAMGIRTLFIESWCRVESLSLTGRLVYPVADAFWVQWPALLAICGGRGAFRGAIL